ncbi:MAG: hypothetical protein A2044_06755 [Candidatus Firestonebacteria bacterium GWA2_43_8]|nr:MAG: hypothetical protein A2044_06755 [Candidatus Firestonebacteria bacterium GWA2_43_8]
MKKIVVALLAVLAALPALAGDRFDGLTYSNSLEGIILDREINGVDPLRNPAYLYFTTKGKISIDSAAYGTGAGSPFKFNVALPLTSGMVLGGTVRYGNQLTWDVWRGILPVNLAANLAYTGNTGFSDSNTTQTETLLTTTTNDDWTKNTVYSGTSNFVVANGGRMDVLGMLAMKMADGMTIGIKAGIELNSDGNLKDISTYAKTFTEAVPLNVKAAADESFTGTRDIVIEQKTAVDPTAIKVVGGALLKIAGMELDISANARLKSGEISTVCSASEAIDLDPDADNTINSTEDWITLNNYVGNGRKSGSKSLAREYKGNIGGMDLGATGVLRMGLNATTTLAIPVSFSSTPYSYSQNRTDTTNVTAVSSTLVGGTANNTHTYKQITSDLYTYDVSTSSLALGAGLNHKAESYNIGIGVKIIVGGSEVTIGNGADSVVTTSTNSVTNNASAGVTDYTTESVTVTSNTASVKTITRSSNSYLFIPVGIEGKVTDRLTVRGGITQAWIMTRMGDVETTTTTPSATTTTTNGGVPVVVTATQSTTVVTNTLPEKQDSTMCTYYSLGLGYTVTDNLSIDISTNASAGGNILDTGNIRASAVLSF